MLRANGVAVRELRDLVRAITGHRGRYHVFEIAKDPRGTPAFKVVIDAKAGAAATRALMKRFDIPADRSDDLR